LFESIPAVVVSFTNNLNFFTMNKMQLNKFRMYDAVNLVLDTHSEMVGTEGDLFAASQLLKAGQATINQNRQVQEADSSGLTKNKSELRSELNRLILLFAAGLKAHATSTKNSELKTKANYKAYDLQKTADSVLADIGRLLHETALPIRSDLAKYAITEPDFQKIEQLLGEVNREFEELQAQIALPEQSLGYLEEIMREPEKMLFAHTQRLRLNWMGVRVDNEPDSKGNDIELAEFCLQEELRRSAVLVSFSLEAIPAP